MGCRVPGADTPSDFWRLLVDGVDTVREVPSDRWDTTVPPAGGPVEPGNASTRRGRFLERVDGFDAAFFRIPPREARAMDPQQRLFLEVAWEALEDAGIALDSVAGTRTGVFAGLNTTDYQQLLTRRAENIDLYYGTGNSFSGAAGRLSYFLNAQGPSIAVDTACSSSLTAIHLACSSLRSGESDLVIAGGVNVMAAPTVFLAMSAGGALAPDGECKTFDEAADGYGRGEGSGAVVLKRLSDALTDGDRIHAVVRGSAVNQDGASGGLTVPSGAAQQAVIRAALARASVQPSDIQYVEAHGTGTPLGDPIELRALQSVLAADRPRGRALLVGAVKTNVGHLEAAAGVIGLIKVVLSMKHRRIPAHRNVRRPTSRFDWSRSCLRLVDGLTDWEGVPSPRTAGVSAFGFTGSNAHVVVQEAPEAIRPSRPAAEPVDRALVLPLSAADTAALSDVADRLSTLWDEDRATASQASCTLDAADVCWTAGVRRSRLDHRAAVVGRSPAQLAAGLRRVRPLQAGAARDGNVWTGTAPAGERRRLAFLYTDRIAALPWLELLAREPSFRRGAARCAAALGRAGGPSSLDLLAAGHTDRPETVFLVLTAATELWREIGLRPDAIAYGGNTGRLAALHACGAIDLADAARLLVTGGTPTDDAAVAALPELLADDAHNSALLAGLGITALLDVGMAGTATRIADVLPRNGLVGVPARNPGEVGDLVADTAAGLYVHGCAVDFGRLIPGEHRVANLPSYPWQHKPYWIPEAEEPGATTRPPIRLGRLGAAYAPADRPGIRYYRIEEPVVSSVSLLEVVAAAVRDTTGGSRPVLRDIAFPRPWTGGGGTDDEAQIVIAHGCAERTAEVVPAGGGACLTARWHLPDELTPDVDLDAIRGRCRETLSVPAPDDDGVTVGGAWSGPAEALVEVRASGGAGAGCGLLPYAIGLLTMWPAEHDTGTQHSGAQLCGAESFSCVDRIDGEVFVHLAREPRGGRLRVLTGDGEVLVDLRGVRTLPVRQDSPPDAGDERLSDNLYRIVWERIDAPRTAPAAAGRWLVAGGRTAHRLAAAFRAAGHRTAVTDADEAARMLADDTAGAFDGAILAPDPEAGPPQEHSAASRYTDTVVARYAEGLRLVEALAGRDQDSAPGPRLWFVTSGAADPLGTAPADPVAAALWQLGRVVAMELPHLWGGLADLAPAAAPDERAALAAALAQRPDDDQLCLRGDRWYAARIAPVAPVADVRPWVASPDLWYVVTDGLEPAGVPFVRRLCAAGARRLLLVSTVGEHSGEAERSLAELRERGVEVRICGTDPLDKELHALQDAGLLGGVVHAAVPASPRPLLTTRPEHVRADLARAVLAARLARHRSPGLFVLSCSAASGWGSVGTAVSAAADAWIVATVARRTASGLPSGLLAVMPRQDTGELDARDLAVLTGSGLSPVEPDRLEAAFSYLVGAGPADLTLARVDRDVYVPLCQQRAPRGFLRRLASDRAGGPPRSAAALAGRIAVAAPGLAEELMLEHVLAVVGDVLGSLGLDDVSPDRGFFDLGLDSLMSLRLRTRLQQDFGTELPATLAFEFPTTRALARHLCAAIPRATAPDTGPPPPLPPLPRHADSTTDDYDDLADDELLSRLEAAIADAETHLAEEN